MARRGSVSCSSPHCHQIFLAMPCDISSAVRPRFLVGCISLANFGCVNASELQIGHLLPSTLYLTAVRHSCPLSQRHQTNFPLPKETSSGVIFPFFVGCHSGDKSGCSRARLFSIGVRKPEQYGHPTPLTLSPTRARHSWPSSQIHQVDRPLFGVTLSGVSSPFLSGCH